MQSILIIDDKTENLVALEALLERPGLSILKANNGNDALKLLIKNDVALVLLDVQMPGMSGFEVATLMKKTRKTQNIPIIFVSADSDKPHQLKGYEMGAVDFLTKPLDPTILLAKVKVFLLLDKQKKSLEKHLLQIHQLKQQNEQLLHALGEGVIAVEADGMISFSNPAMESLFGISQSNVIGQNISKLIFQNIEGVETAWPKTDLFLSSSQGERLQSEAGFFIKTANGLQPIRLSVAPIPTSNQYVGAVITLGHPMDKETALEELERKNRRHSRKRIGTVLRLFDRKTGMNIGRLVNISADGLKISSRDEIAVGSEFPISMILPETMAGSNTLSFDIQAVWCRPADDVDGEFRTGFRITKIGENDRNILSQLISNF